MTDDLRALIADVIADHEDDMFADIAGAILKQMHAEGYLIVHAPCEECRQIHPSYPFARAYHSPICSARAVCNACHTPFGHHPTGEVGALCPECAE